MKKDLFGWIALAVFIGSCLYMGLNRLWMKNTNLTVLISLGIAVVIVWLLNFKKPSDDEKKDKSSSDK